MAESKRAILVSERDLTLIKFSVGEFLEALEVSNQSVVRRETGALYAYLSQELKDYRRSGFMVQLKQSFRRQARGVSW